MHKRIFAIDSINKNVTFILQLKKQNLALEISADLKVRHLERSFLKSPTRRQNFRKLFSMKLMII